MARHIQNSTIGRPLRRIIRADRWNDATRVQDMPALGYQMLGHRLATEGSLRPEEEGMVGQES